MEENAIGQKKILVVDDEPEIRELLKEFLTKKGYAVSTAYSGETAIEKIEKEDFDIMLLDMAMFGMSGLDVLRKVKELNKQLPIIMITAVKDDSLNQQCFTLGAADYITKPLDLNYLENVLLMKLLAL